MILKRRKPAKMGLREAPQIRSASHLQWIRGCECSVMARMPHDADCSGKIQSAHVRRGTDGGTSLKPGDNWTIPLCEFHHERQHDIGEQSFERLYGLQMKTLAADLWQRSPAGKRYRMEHP